MAIETYEHEGLTVKIDTDTDSDSESPRDWDNMGTMACFHGRYQLGDKDHGLSMEELESLCARKDVISLPLYLYDHSGITMNTTGFSCGWDSGQVGRIYIELDKVRKEYGVKRVTKKIRDKVLDNLRSEVNTYDQFIRGEVYCYTIEKDGEHVDSCGGFFGLDYCKEEANEAAEHENERALEIAKANG